jgi:2-polyprenyl-3-methyl-5-hydroxy-6-metoxy-1,4-benzoquinol methylase
MAGQSVKTFDGTATALTPASVDRCPACGSPRRNFIGSVPDSLVDELGRASPETLDAWVNTIARCQDCRLHYLDPRPDASSLKRLYRLWYGHGYSDTPHSADGDTARAQEFEKFHLSQILRATGQGGGRLLDVGSGTGLFVQVAQIAGWTAEGIDASVAAVDRAQTAGRRVSLGEIADVARRGERFDLITMFDMLEHTETPADDLRAAVSCLREGGAIAIRVPNFSGLQARMMGLRWVGVMSLHLTYFDRASLFRLLEQSGLHVVSVGAGNYRSLYGLLKDKLSWVSYRLTRGRSEASSDRGGSSPNPDRPTARRPLAFLVGSVWELVDHVGGWIGQGNQLFVVARRAK